jgi:hypothetical protein
VTTRGCTRLGREKRQGKGSKMKKPATTKEEEEKKQKNTSWGVGTAARVQEHHRGLGVWS